jgi:hypothetical protein
MNDPNPKRVWQSLARKIIFLKDSVHVSGNGLVNFAWLNGEIEEGINHGCNEISPVSVTTGLLEGCWPKRQGGEGGLLLPFYFGNCL